MNDLNFPILSALIFLPVAGAALLLLISRSNESLIKWISLIVSTAAFIISIPLFTEFNKSTHLMQFTEKHSWIPSLNINYSLGIDGISILFVLLSTLITILCVLISWNSIKAKVKEFYISILIMEGAMLGVFCALDFMLFYLFWEAMLIPMYLLIGVWGGSNRIYAAVKFFLYTLAGSVLMLVGIIVLYYQSGRTLDILELTAKTYPYPLQLWLFWAFFAAFAVKVPMFPLHTWLPDAHTEAPTAGSVILAAVLIKMGAYGFIRFSLPLFPEASRAMTPVMLAL
ncbi:MAG: NADH-quinone oxidoreductase subunit M, partial [Nitrospirae bacterium CG_4_10_14_3_um_filter_44_29]